MVCMYALSPDPHHQPCRGLSPPRATLHGMLQTEFMDVFLTQHQGLFVGNLEKTSNPHSPSSTGEDSSVLSWRRRQLSFSDWPAVLSLPRGAGTKVMSSSCTARSIKPRDGCPGGPAHGRSHWPWCHCNLHHRRRPCIRLH